MRQVNPSAWLVSWHSTCVSHQQERLAPLPKGERSSSMAQMRSTQRTLTLQESLESLTRLGERYLLVSGEQEWRANDLLDWLQTEHPTLLALPVYLVSPDANGYGAVFEVDLYGEPITDVPLYRIERRLPTVHPL